MDLGRMASLAKIIITADLALKPEAFDGLYRTPVASFTPMIERLQSSLRSISFRGKLSDEVTH